MEQIPRHDPARGVDVGWLAEYPVQAARLRRGQVGNEDAVLKVAFLEAGGHAEFSCAQAISAGGS
ncbi:MAG: hypothetical protein AW09_003020 [Candidatus Accumulibacter phosphatis]|uniref:Uncharacterized protein n=1 Tax=Candidatus Accumulibacter phosphatis TaxID=327160 RepID=A0A080M3Y6_9PROT|nr:MAG: hypothetical protein AW09_003020 [Candidatus Accumulibacter phosphatis]